MKFKDVFPNFESFKLAMNAFQPNLIQTTDGVYYNLLDARFGDRHFNAKTESQIKADVFTIMSEFKVKYIGWLKDIPTTDLKDLIKNTNSNEVYVNALENVSDKKKEEDIDKFVSNGGSNVFMPSLLQIINPLLNIPNAYQVLISSMESLFAIAEGDDSASTIDGVAIDKWIKELFKTVGSDITINLPDGSVTTQKIKDNAVVANKIMDGAITQSKLAPGINIGGGGGGSAYDDTQIKADLRAETASRVSGDTALGNRIDNLNIPPAYDDTQIKRDLATETTNRQTADGGLGARITALNTKVDNLPQGGGGSAGVADGSITTSKLADQAVTVAKIGNFAVTSSKLAFNSVRNIHIGTGSIQTRHIRAEQITKGKILDGAVSGDKIADNAITENKLADAVVAKLGGGGVDGINSNGDITITKSVNISGNNRLFISTQENYNPSDINRVLNQKHLRQMAAAEGWGGSSIEDDSITTAMIKDKAITASKIASGVIPVAGVSSWEDITSTYRNRDFTNDANAVVRISFNRFGDRHTVTGELKTHNRLHTYDNPSSFFGVVGVAYNDINKGLATSRLVWTPNPVTFSINNPTQFSANTFTTTNKNQLYPNAYFARFGRLETINITKFEIQKSGIPDGSVVAEKIAAGVVSVPKLAPDVIAKFDNISHQIETHKAHLGITNDKINSLTEYGITDNALKSAWDETNNDTNSIFGVFNEMFNDAKSFPVFAEGSINQVGNYFFSTIMRAEQTRAGGYLNKSAINTAKHLRLAMGQNANSKIITIFNADYGTANYRSGVRFTQNRQSGNWDNGRDYTYSASVDQYFVYETLDQNSTFIKDNNNTIKSMNAWVNAKNANQFFKTGQNKYLASSIGETSTLDRVSGQANRWLSAKVANVEKNTKRFPTVPNSAGITLSAGVYQIRFKHTFYDVGGGENYIRLDLSGNQNTDYLLSNWESVNGGFVPSQDVATHVYYCGGLIKVLTGKNVVIKPEVRTHKNTARSSGWGHKQSIARQIRQNEFRVVQLDSGREPV